MPADLPLEAEGLLFELAKLDFQIQGHRDEVERRRMEIAETLSREAKKEAQATPASQHRGIRARYAERLLELYRTAYRSELAHLHAPIVRDERRRAGILRQLEAYPQLGELVPAIDLAVEHDGERGFTIRTGGGRVHRFTLPIVIDRGLWRADGKYERGDAVTSDGSLWIARRDSPEHEPGKGDAWRLAVTRGRNGRDANRMGTTK